MARIERGHHFLSGFGDEDYLEDFSMGKDSKASPIVNISENSNRYKLELGIPGIRREELNIKVNDSTLLITSKREVVKDDSEERFHTKQIDKKDFKRIFHLPKNVLIDEIDANYKDGILQILIPKKELAESNTSTVEIN